MKARLRRAARKNPQHFPNRSGVAEIRVPLSVFHFGHGCSVFANSQQFLVAADVDDLQNAKILFDKEESVKLCSLYFIYIFDTFRFKRIYESINYFLLSLLV